MIDEKSRSRNFALLLRGKGERKAQTYGMRCSRQLSSVTMHMVDFGYRRTFLPTVAIMLSLCSPVLVAQEHAPNPAPHAQAKRSTSEQTSFCEDDRLTKPVAVPRAVAAAIMESEAGKEALEGTAEADVPSDATKLFRASRIRLSPNETMLVVIGSAPMNGADNTWFWVVAHPYERPTILLWVGANCLSVLRTTASGYRDIGTDWASASERVTTLYKFDGTKYREVRKNRKPNDW
jgi:hypothetical protein